MLKNSTVAWAPEHLQPMHPVYPLELGKDITSAPVTRIVFPAVMKLKGPSKKEWKMEPVFSLSNFWQKCLLYCGIFAPIVYLGTDWLAGWILKGYSFKTQSMSDLSAVGSPVRPIVVSLTLAACLLMIAFGIGIWLTEGHQLLARIVAVLVIGNAVTGFIATAFFPTHYGERPAFFSPGVLLSLIHI